MSEAPYLGLDIGLRRTGVALSDSGLVVRPLTVIEWEPPHRHSLIEELVTLVKQYEIRTIVAGLPLDNGAPTAQSVKTVSIIDELRVALGPTVEIVTVDESYTTAEALEHYPEVDKDAAAAAIILQNYLDLLSP